MKDKITQSPAPRPPETHDVLIHKFLSLSRCVYIVCSSDEDKTFISSSQDPNEIGTRLMAGKRFNTQFAREPRGARPGPAA